MLIEVFLQTWNLQNPGGGQMMVVIVLKTVRFPEKGNRFFGASRMIEQEVAAVRRIFSIRRRGKTDNGQGNPR